VYRSDESGRYELFAETVAPGGGRWQISTIGGEEPQWRRDGKELFFISHDTLMSVGIQLSGNTLMLGIPRPLFKVSLPSVRRRNDYVVTPDGQRFLVIVPEQGPPPTPILVLNWPALLTKR
jgi:hypothetical protein